MRQEPLSFRGVKSLGRSSKFNTLNIVKTIMVVTTFVCLGALVGAIGYLATRPETESIGLPSTVKPPVVQVVQPDSIPAEFVLAKNLIKSEDIVLEKADVNPQIPPYNLPLKTEDISNWQKFSEKIQLSPEALSLLEKNGFAVISTPEDIRESEVFLISSKRSAYPKDDFVAYYQKIADKDLPIFITTDSLLHYYHIFFDTTLMKLERDLFYDDVWQMSKEFFDDSVREYNAAAGDLKEAVKRNVAYISVALELLKPKRDQVMSDETLKEEYCGGETDSYCEMMIKGVKEQYGEKASFKYFNDEEFNRYSFEAPDFVKQDVQKEIEFIEKHEGWEFSPIFIYKEDYSQYVPRGHYTKSEKLKNYFKTLMWYGRMTALIKGSDLIPEGKSLRKIQEEGGAFLGIDDTKGLLSVKDAKIQTLQANLISNKFSKSKDIQERWTRMYAITSFFVGFSDDLGPYEYSAVLKSLFEKELTVQEVEEKYPDIRDTLLNLSYNPKIYSGLDACQMFMSCPPLSDEEIQELKVQAKKLLEATKGFRLMGQRFTIDSWLFSEIVSPYSGEYIGQKFSLPTDEKPFTFSWDDSFSEYRNSRPFTWVKTDVKACPPPAAREVRGFPRGLDIMALFGSERAKEILRSEGDSQYSDYEKKFSELKSEIDSFSTDDWFKNLYWNWIYVLRSLLEEYGEGYQTFMQTDAWQDKELSTALASWTELRHDTILYVKQSYTMAEMGAGPQPPVVGYVEPVPEFYARLLTLTKMTNKGLKGLVPSEELEKLQIEPALDSFSQILERLLAISKKELENKPLSDDEYAFIKGFGKVSENLIRNVSGGEVDPEIFKAVLVADVHTEGNTEKVLEEGVGYIKTALVAYKLPEGHILLGIGPVFSYYEFKQPMEARLTDEAWRVMLDTKHPSEPEWTKSFSE